ncbi:MAG: trimethylamine methyltransferase family protein [Candidatus Promineifilaceae bacterium]
MRPTLNILSDEQIEKILDEAKRILSEVGIEVRGAALRGRLLAHGLKLDEAGTRVLFPPEVVERAIETSPRSFTLYDRNGRPHADLGDNRVHFVPGSSGLKVLDHRTGETRLANTADFTEYVRLADGLPHIAYLATAFSTNDDIDPQVSDAWRLYLCLIHSLKPVVSGAFTEHGVPRMAQMMQLFRHDRADLIARPMAVFTITATGMFRYSEDSCQNLLDCVEWGIPIEVVPVTLMGLIAPVTVMGAAVFHAADVLAGLTMAQIIRPGAPVLFGGAPAAFHMKAATSPMIAVEALQLDMAYVAVAKSLRLPTQGYLALSEGKFLDAQAGAETYGSAMLAALAGINSVSGPGMLDYVMVFSLAKLLLDDEWCGHALRLVRDVQLKEDIPTIPLVRDLLAEQHLITAEHTLNHWPSELYLPGPTLDRDNRENWVKAGSPLLEDRVHAELERRLAAYEGLETEPQISAEMANIIQSGMTSKRPLPAIPPIPKQQTADTGRHRRRTRRSTN